MTRKTCNNHPHVDTLLWSVCPEIFQSDDFYIETDPHEALETLVKANGIVLNKVIASMTRNKMPRTRSSSICYKVKHSFSPTNNDVGPRLRARKYTPYINNFMDTSGDDDSNHHVRPMRELRSTTKLAMLQLKSNHESNVWDSGRPKRTCIKQKRISADERLVVDNRTYYKVELMSNKLRSSGIPIRNTETFLSKKIKSPPFEDSADDKSLLVKVKRHKISEIVRLNNEAENFLFPRKNEPISENETDTEVAEHAYVNKREIVTNNLNSRLSKIKNEPEEETSMDSISSESSVAKKKRRLTQAEAFILDNQQYYKFETPGSRLRYQGSYLPSLATKNNGEYNVKHTKTRVPQEGLRPDLKLDEIDYSFEVVPKSESWYKTFQRQDRGEECYTCYNYSSDYCNPFLLPYELGPLPPLDPSVCVAAYNYKKRQLFGGNVPSTSTNSCNIEDMCTTGEDTKSSEDSEFLNGSISTPKLPIKRRRRGLFGNSKTPRKSPRQHASTLAILSSLIQQRKRRGDAKRSRNSSKQNFLAINEEMEISEVDCDMIARNINDMLLNSTKEMDPLDIITNEESNIDLHYKPDIIETLHSFSDMEEVCNGSKPSKKASKNNPIVRKHWRKKKKNRTGWPNKTKRTVFRKDISDNRKERGKNNVAKCRRKRNKSDNNHNKRLSNYVEGRGSNVNKINGDIQTSKLNGVNDNINLVMSRRKEHRDSSSDNCAEVVVASVGDKIDCVNVDLDKWENAERVLSAKIRSEDINNDIQFQPIVRVQKLDSDLTLKCTTKEISVSPSPRRTRSRRMPASPKSSRILRKPRGGWYRHNNN